MNKVSLNIEFSRAFTSQDRELVGKAESSLEKANWDVKAMGGGYTGEKDGDVVCIKHSSQIYKGKGI